MPAEFDCERVAERLEAAFWSSAPSSKPDTEHAAGCSTCGARLEELQTLAAALGAHLAPELDPDRASSILRLAARELAARGSRPVALPSGYARELLRILAWAVLPLPLVVFAYAQLFELGGAMLGRILPEWIVMAVGIAAACASASWMAVVYGSIPLVAYRRLSRIEVRT